jgi:Protein of unknown function (DUF1236)
MKWSLLSMVSGAVLLSAGVASADTSTTTTTTWTNQEGAMIREQSVTKHYDTVTDPSMQATVGSEVPATVTMHPLPETVTVTDPDRYSYVVINDHPVVVERTTRRIVHVW